MKKILIIVLILVLIGVVFLFLASKKEAKKPPVTNVSITNQEVAPVVNQPVAKTEELTAEEKITLLKNELKLKARNFIERYSSFSTDARFANLKELKDEMTDKLWRETESYISSKEKEPIQEFYSITTRVLNVKEIFFSENEAKYLILTQRQEKKGTTENVFYQEVELKMVKENNVWKIDEVKWQ